MLGYGGKLLRVNLTNGSIKEEPFLEKNAKKYLGGRGMAVKILLEEQEANVDPFGPYNKLVLMSGPLSGSPLFGTPRFLIATKSPLTRQWGEAVSGGYFAHEFKKTGLDGIILEGQSEKPVYLFITNNKAEFRSAEDLWGLTCTQTEQKIRHIIENKSAEIISIGPAGEKLVKFACIMNGDDAAGRCGIGAVMGSKKLKAIVVSGNKNPQYQDREKLRKLSKKILEKFKKTAFYPSLRTVGTSGAPAGLSDKGMLPTKNFNDTFFEQASDITLSADKYKIEHRGCRGCPVACKKHVVLSDNKKYKAPEYETEAVLGSLILNKDYESIFKAGEICDKYGMDTISTGVVIAFATECFENGILTEDKTDGLKLKWGNSNAIIKLTERIAKRESWLGEILGEGVRIAAEVIGHNAKEYAMHVKGLEIPMHTPRAKKALGFNYCTSVRGACHCQIDHDPAFEKSNSFPDLDIVEKMHRYQVTGKARVVKISQDRHSLRECLITCLFTSADNVFTLADTCEALKACTGLQFSPKELMLIGERVHNMCRLFSIREGLSREQEHLPRRFATSIGSGPAKGQSFTEKEVNGLLDKYYTIRGWTKEGVPTNCKLEELGLSHLNK